MNFIAPKDRIVRLHGPYNLHHVHVISGSSWGKEQRAGGVLVQQTVDLAVLDVSFHFLSRPGVVLVFHVHRDGDGPHPLHQSQEFLGGQMTSYLEPLHRVKLVEHGKVDGQVLRP